MRLANKTFAFLLLCLFSLSSGCILLPDNVAAELDAPDREQPNNFELFNEPTGTKSGGKTKAI